MVNTSAKYQPERPVIKVEDIIDDALYSLGTRARVLRSLHGELVVNSGRQYMDGAPVVVRVSVPSNPGCIVKITDAGVTLARVGIQTEAPGEHALSVRRDLLAHLSVQEHQGAVMITATPNRAGEALGLLADACITLDTAALVAKHLRFRETYTLVGGSDDVADPDEPAVKQPA